MTNHHQRTLLMKTVFLAAAVAVAFSGSAFALAVNGTGLNLSGMNGTSLNLGGMNGTVANGSGSNSPAVVDLNSLRLLRAVIRH
jgi:hypothetical protein